MKDSGHQAVDQAIIYETQFLVPQFRYTILVFFSLTGIIVGVKGKRSFVCIPMVNDDPIL